MKVAIMGAGAIGAYVGARLAQAGLEVALIARGDHLHAIRK
ncbi:MAG: 2-dehydropantoate 2-reductase N-terminal domain-containing protein, partial [Pseudomonadota bacterium]